MADFGLAAFPMSASFLAYQRAPEKGQGRSNGQTLFGIGRIPRSRETGLRTQRRQTLVRQAAESMGEANCSR
jgi:hypothetical protein